MNTIINFLFSAIKFGTPLMLGTTGEIVTEKSGSLNLGIEGMMAMGAIIGYIVAARANDLFLGILCAFLFAAFGALIFAFLTVTLQANQNVTGLALTIFGVGLYKFIGQSLMVSGKYPAMKTALSNMIAEKPLPLLGDIPYVGKLLFSHSIFVYLAVLICVMFWIYLKYTKTGLKVRSLGENPAAADASGVNVNFMKYIHIIMGGGICGIGGLYLALVVNAGGWNDYWINGFGWISIALVIFASWSPMKAIFGSIIFGMFKALQIRSGDLAHEFPKVLGWLQSIPADFYQMLPFVVTALVLIISSMRKKKEGAQPAWCGVNYYREDR
ncbi:MAG: ABC transporter permease [Clostridia bacterium]|nr:ABC transporter permease [Clostridia bacterium]